MRYFSIPAGKSIMQFKLCLKLKHILKFSFHSTNIYGHEYIIIKFHIWSITRTSVIKFSSNFDYGLPLIFSDLARRFLRSNSIYVYIFYSAHHPISLNFKRHHLSNWSSAHFLQSLVCVSLKILDHSLSSETQQWVYECGILFPKFSWPTVKKGILAIK